MKRVMKLFWIAVVGLIVFVGGLCIALGIREHRTNEEEPVGVRGVIPIFEFQEGSAL